MILISPVIFPMFIGIAMVLFRLDKKNTNTMAVIGALLQIIISGLLMVTILDQQAIAVWVGSWPAPAGICLVADYLSAVMVLITSIIHMAVIMYARKDINGSQVKAGFYPFMQLLTAAICGAFLTGDLFNLYVWFEVMLMASFGIMVMERSAGRMPGIVKYVTMNLLSTLFLITAIGLVYGLTGTLNLADLYEKIALVENSALINGVALLLITAFGIKSALFPLFFWLPASYHKLPIPVSAFFAGMLTKVGIYALIRMFTLVFIGDTAMTHTALMVLAVLTMVSGVVAAASQTDIRRILSFHIISQVGYMVLGLSLFTPLALTGTLIYLVHHIIVKTNLFLVSGLVQKSTGSFDLRQIGSVYKTNGMVSAGFFIPAFSLAGFPPLSGFWAKFLIIYACLENQHYSLGAVAAIVGLMTLFSMVKIWQEAFWKPFPESRANLVEPKPLSAWVTTPVVGLALITILTGLFMEPVYRVGLVVGEQLMNPMPYILAVKGGV